MKWQDWAITAIQWSFLLALIPTLLHPTDKPALSSSLLTAALGFALCFVYVTLLFWIAAFSTFVLAVVWVVIAWQRHQLNRQTDPGRNIPFGKLVDTILMR